MLDHAHDDGVILPAGQVDPATIQGCGLSALGAGEWETPQLLSLLRATASGFANVESYQMELRREGRKVRYLALNAQKLDYADPDNIHLLLTVCDITAVRDAEAILARVIAGAAIGIASFVAPLYISEIAPVEVRGKLVSINQVALTSGIVISYLVDHVFAGAQAWRWMFALAAIPATGFGIGLMFIPDSPRWLVGDGRVNEARTVLKRIRPPTRVDGELSEIQHSAAQQEAHWSELFSPLLRAPMIVGVGLAMGLSWNTHGHNSMSPWVGAVQRLRP